MIATNRPRNNRNEALACGGIGNGASALSTSTAGTDRGTRAIMATTVANPGPVVRAVTINPDNDDTSATSASGSLLSRAIVVAPEPP